MMKDSELLSALRFGEKLKWEEYPYDLPPQAQGILDIVVLPPLQANAIDDPYSPESEVLVQERCFRLVDGYWERIL